MAYNLGFACLGISVFNVSSFPFLKSFDTPYQSFLGSLARDRVLQQDDTTLRMHTPSALARKR